MTDRLAALAGAGVAIWLDDISRQRLVSGNLADLVAHKHVVGVTSNPTIFAKAVSDSDAYDDQLRALAAKQVPVDAAVRQVITDDIRDAADVLKPAFDASDGVDGRVSLEVDPRLARDTDKTIAEASTLWATVGRDNMFIKIPATHEGLAAITASLANGISINVTLIFSLQRYREVMDAWLSGLEQAKANGHDLHTIASVASFFVSRVDTEVDKRLDALTGDAAATGAQYKSKAGIANARLAFAEYEKVIASDRWAALAAAGARPQRPLWASTSTKNPDLPDTLYVTELVTNGVVNTLPEPTLDAFADHGELRGDTVRGTAAESQQVLDGLAAVGVDYDDVVKVVEDEGVDKFDKSWRQLRDTVGEALANSGTAGQPVGAGAGR